MPPFRVFGNIVDIHHNKIFSGSIQIENGRIAAILPEAVTEAQYILPGFVDSHIHIESSMLVPSEFARLAVVHGTVATVSDPHEIANVLGLEGIRYMIKNSEKTPFQIYFGASPCVPATNFETAGAKITVEDIKTLFTEDKLKYLSEMMNYPGVLHKDPEVLAKIAIAKMMGKPIDGHAPGLRGNSMQEYCQAGISTDHECYSLEEALDKIQAGMKILIREGSAAKNYAALHPLLKSFPSKVMFCNDDLHPNDLVRGHINLQVRRSIELGYDVMDVLRSACLNPIEHYKLETGTLKKGDAADFIVVDNLCDFNVKATYISGLLVAREGRSLIERTSVERINHFNCNPIQADLIATPSAGEIIPVIQAISGELVTKKLMMKAKIAHGHYLSDPSKDILKLVVINRYGPVIPATAFIHGFNLKAGALASSIAHDSHNIIAVGVDDLSICSAVNAVIESQGGVAIAQKTRVDILPLPIAGLMSAEDGYLVAKQYEEIKQKAFALGTQLADPFMTLSFMALLVIPSLKLSDRGLFDSDLFEFVK
jgi:adenine deaminase